MKKVGITARISGEAHHSAYSINRDYAHAMTRNGVIPIVLTPMPKEQLKELFEQLDGLIVIGGLDVNPTLYGETPHPTTYPIQPDLEQLDIDCLSLADQYHLPVLGICRGHQIINVYYGGTLIQDIPSQFPTILEHSQKRDPYGTIHTVTIDHPELTTRLGKEIRTNSFHHQAILNVADGFHIYAQSTDGLVEGIYNDRILSVQWHPERLRDDTSNELFRYWISKL